MNDFYDELVPYYHLIFEDWEASMEWQANSIAGIITQQWGRQVGNILDVSCGIGTQVIGLALKDFRVIASDISVKAIERAQKEAFARNLDIAFSVCDMRDAYQHHRKHFDVVMSCDNSVAHLLSDNDIHEALKAMHACTRPGRGCPLTIRDYDKEERGHGLLKPYGVRGDGKRRFVVFQVWDFDGDQYDLSMYFLEENLDSGTTKTHVMRSRCYAISPNHLLELMRSAGFESVTRLDNEFYQPVLVGTRWNNKGMDLTGKAMRFYVEAGAGSKAMRPAG
jgi:SAM-dependent methyltransferase